MAEAKTDSPKMPPGIPYIIGNEAAERFSYYGMRAILVIYMTKYLVDMNGDPATMTDAQAREWFHMFGTAVYFFPLIGAILSDILWGKYKTIITLSVVYCAGHAALALGDLHILFEPKTWLAIGLFLIAVGSGGIKPCVSAHVGDQFTADKSSLVSKVFSWFYFSINFGAFISSLLTPYLLDKVGPAVAFGLPGLLMLVATWAFYLGRTKFTAVPPAGWAKYKEECFGPKGIKAITGLGVLYIFIASFWALFDQTGSSWVLQAEKMNRMVDLGFVKFELLSSQIQAVNPIMIMMFIPIFNMWIYPAIDKVFKLNPLRKIGIGFFITAISFSIIAFAEHIIEGGGTPSIMWQFVAYAVITGAEVMISITALEYSYTQAPNAMKSIIMGVFFLSVSLGNYVTALVNKFIQNDDGTVALTGPQYYWFFVGLVTVCGILYIFAAKAYKEESYFQEHGGKLDA